jgi:hypothetical protein
MIKELESAGNIHRGVSRRYAGPSALPDAPMPMASCWPSRWSGARKARRPASSSPRPAAASSRWGSATGRWPRCAASRRACTRPA